MFVFLTNNNKWKKDIHHISQCRQGFYSQLVAEAVKNAPIVSGMSKKQQDHGKDKKKKKSAETPPEIASGPGSSQDKNCVKRPFEIGEKIFFFSKDDDQYIPGIVKEITIVQGTLFYRIQKNHEKHPSEWEQEQKDPSASLQYVKTKPALVKYDSFWKIMKKRRFRNGISNKFFKKYIS